MESKEYIGKIIIEEIIDTINEYILPGTLVFDVPDPFQNYYNEFPEIVKPNSIIFITKTANSYEKILRVTKGINKKYGLNLDGAKCELTIGSRKLNGIRLKGIFRYTEIEQIQKYYKEAGYEFAKSEKFKDTKALIRINRYFYLKELEKGVYQSRNESHMFYFEVPRYMSWDEFSTLTYEIKNNILDSYAIAKGIFYTKDGITEMLRVVKPKVTVELIKLIQQKYIEKLQ